MNKATVFARTSLGTTEMQNPKSSIAGDEKRLLLQVDGKSSLEEIGKKVPPSVRSHLEEVFGRLLFAKFIVEVNADAGEEAQKANVIAKNIKTPSRVSKEEVQAILMTSQKFNKNVLVLAEVEIERRIELEQDLAVSEARATELLSKLSQAEAQASSANAKYETLKQQVMTYKKGMQAKVEAMQAFIQKNTVNSQESQTQRAKADADLEKMREDFERLQANMEEKEANLDSTLKRRVLEAKQIEEEQRRRSKMEAEEMARAHPRYAELRRLHFFKDFRNSDLAQFLVWAEWRDCKAGETVVVEGEQDVMFYVIVSGKLAVLRGERTLHILHAGEPFGEIAFLDEDNSHRSASVVARTDCSLLQFNPAYLDGAEVMIRLRVAEAFVRIQAKRLRRAIEMVENLLGEGAV
ncbi:MAG: cyclic nucleotide-binding domain-containing protein [Gallionella sp.]|nr:cyclic nucleotide-binding domain-containing protein [Gallionella sp.]